MRGANLIQTNFTNSNITGIKLYGSARDDWLIDGIKCAFVFWDEEGTKRTPSEADFQSGEFETLYKQLPTFDYFFKHGFTAFDAVVMDRVVQSINHKQPEFQLKLDSFHSRSQPHAKFTVLHKEYSEEAKQLLTEDYEARIQTLEGRMEKLQQVLNQLADQPLITINKLAITGKGNVEMGDTYNSKGQVGAMGRGAQATQNTFLQLWQDECLNITLSVLADEFSKLRNEMQNKATSIEQEISIDEVANAEQAARDGDGPKMLGHLKKAGKWALECAKEIGTDFAAAVIKKSLGV